MANALPLVTLTLTTDELAKCSAGLIQLRRMWAGRVVELPENKQAEGLETIKGCTDLINRLATLVTQEQAADLMNGLIRERRERGD